MHSVPQVRLNNMAPQGLRHRKKIVDNQLPLKRILRFLKITAWIKVSPFGPKGSFQGAANDVANSRYWMCRPSSVASVFHKVTLLTRAAALSGLRNYPLTKRGPQSLVWCHRACLDSGVLLCLCLGPSFWISLSCLVHRSLLVSPAPHQSCCPSSLSTLPSFCQCMFLYFAFGWQHSNIHNPSISKIRKFLCATMIAQVSIPWNFVSRTKLSKVLHKNTVHVYDVYMRHKLNFCSDLGPIPRMSL